MRAERELFYRSFNVWFLSIFFSRLHVQSTRDGRSGKDSLFGRLESRAPFITPVLTVYVISLGERQNGQAECGVWSKKEIKRSGDGMTEFSHSSVGPSSFFRGRRNCYTGTSNNNGAISLSLYLSLVFILTLSYIKPPTSQLSIHPSVLPCL